MLKSFETALKYAKYQILILALAMATFVSGKNDPTRTTDLCGSPESYPTIDIVSVLSGTMLQCHSYTPLKLPEVFLLYETEKPKLRNFKGKKDVASND